jgi:hypothetical protein
MKSPKTALLDMPLTLLFIELAYLYGARIPVVLMSVPRA